MKGKFTRLVLESWRNFKKVDVPLAERVFIVGPNASGKSNLLDVFRFLQELAADGGGLTNAFQGANRGGIRSVRSLHARSKSNVKIEVAVEIGESTWIYRLVLQASGTPQKPGPAVVVEERVWDDGVDRLRRPDSKDRGDKELLLATALEQRSANANFRPLRDFLRSVEYNHVVPQLVRQPKVDDHSRFGKGLGTGLVEAIWGTPKKLRDRRLTRIGRALKIVLPQFENLVSETDADGRPHLRAQYTHWRQHGGWQQESAFSDGTLRLIGLLWYLSAGEAPLLLEEPELSLHPAAVRQIPRLLASISSQFGRQVLMSTHSPELLGDTGIDPSEVLLLRTTKDGTDVTLGSSLRELIQAAEADLPLGPHIEALTRPKGIEELLSFAEEA